MAVRFSTYVAACSKRGSEPDEYEDAYSIAGDRGDAAQTSAYVARANRCHRYAVADGATTSSYSKEWAELLVGAFTRQRFNPSISNFWLRTKPLQMHWRQMVPSQDLPWYAQEKLRRGAFAAFLGLSLSSYHFNGERVTGTWKALAIGDTCLFHIRANKLIAAFPIRSSQAFTSTPTLFSTETTANVSARRAARVQIGNWMVGDQFILMTDAIAAWFLRQDELDEKPWTQIVKPVLSPLEWQTWVDKQRADKVMRNDDVTLVKIVIEG